MCRQIRHGYTEQTNIYTHTHTDIVCVCVWSNKVYIWYSLTKSTLKKLINCFIHQDMSELIPTRLEKQRK